MRQKDSYSTTFTELLEYHLLYFQVKRINMLYRKIESFTKYFNIYLVITIFLGVVIDRMNLGTSGWGIMIGWSLWVVILPLAIEFYDLLFENRSGKPLFF